MLGDSRKSDESLLKMLTTIRQIRISSRSNGRILKLFPLILFTIGLSGCITLREYAEQRRTPSPNYPPVYRFVDDPHSECLKAGAPNKVNFTIWACANWNGGIVPGKCLIILPKEGWEQHLEHELLHCEFGRWHD